MEREAGGYQRRWADWLQVSGWARSSSPRRIKRQKHRRAGTQQEQYQKQGCDMNPHIAHRHKVLGIVLSFSHKKEFLPEMTGLRFYSECHLVTERLMKTHQGLQSVWCFYTCFWFAVTSVSHGWYSEEQRGERRKLIDLSGAPSSKNQIGFPYTFHHRTVRTWCNFSQVSAQQRRSKSGKTVPSWVLVFFEF